MSKQSELFTHFLRRRASSLCLSLAVSLCLVACWGKTTNPELSYELSQRAFQSELESPLTLQIQGNKIEFAIAFKGGGGSYDEVRSERSKEIVRLVLFDTDGKLQNMWVVYQLSGSISGLELGEYTFHIEDADGKLIADDVFTIQ